MNGGGTCCAVSKTTEKAGKVGTEAKLSQSLEARRVQVKPS